MQRKSNAIFAENISVKVTLLFLAVFLHTLGTKTFYCFYCSYMEVHHPSEIRPLHFMTITFHHTIKCLWSKTVMNTIYLMYIADGYTTILFTLF